MSHTYLIDLYQLIEQRKQEAEKELQTESSAPIATRLQQGRLDILTEFKSFLVQNYHHKLPRRIRSRYAE